VRTANPGLGDGADGRGTVESDVPVSIRGNYNNVIRDRQLTPTLTPRRTVRPDTRHRTRQWILRDSRACAFSYDLNIYATRRCSLRTVCYACHSSI